MPQGALLRSWIYRTIPTFPSHYLSPRPEMRDALFASRCGQVRDNCRKLSRYDLPVETKPNAGCMSGYKWRGLSCPIFYTRRQYRACHQTPANILTTIFKMAITHVVIFSFKPDISDADREHVSERISLKNWRHWTDIHLSGPEQSTGDKGQSATSHNGKTSGKVSHRGEE